MSGVFTDTGTQTTGASEQTNTDQTTSSTFVNQLVEAKGSNFNDPEVVAKSKLEADAFIANLERQNSELREDLSKQDYAKDLLTQLQTKANETLVAQPNNNNTTDTISDDDTKSLESGDIESLINDALVKKDADSKTLANLQVVDSKLDELYGTEATKRIETKSKELGLSVDYLKSMAAESPQAFFTLIGEEGVKVTNPVTQSTVNTANAYNQTSERDYAFYSKLRKENPKSYFTPKVQTAMASDSERLGDKFYSN